MDADRDDKVSFEENKQAIEKMQKRLNASAGEPDFGRSGRI